MTSLTHEFTESFDATPERVFAALTTLDGVKGWHTPTATGSGDVGTEWVFSFADHPEFGWEVVTSEAPSTVVWRCTRGPGDSVGTTASFTLAGRARTATSANATRRGECCCTTCATTSKPATPHRHSIRGAP